jgi:hypothetical protein
VQKLQTHVAITLPNFSCDVGERNSTAGNGQRLDCFWIDWLIIVLI